MPSKKHKTTDVNSLKRATLKIADSLGQEYHTTKGVTVAKEAISAYRLALNAMRIKLLYNKHMESQAKIQFFE